MQKLNAYFTRMRKGKGKGLCYMEMLTVATEMTHHFNRFKLPGARGISITSGPWAHGSRLTLGSPPPADSLHPGVGFGGNERASIPISLYFRIDSMCQALPFVPKASGNLTVAEASAVPGALLRVGAAARAARSHARRVARPRWPGSFPGSRPRGLAPPGPPLLRAPGPGAWERSRRPERRAEAPLRCAPRDPSGEPRTHRGARSSAGAAWGPRTRGASARPELEAPVTYLMSSHTSGP